MMVMMTPLRELETCLIATGPVSVLTVALAANPLATPCEGAISAVAGTNRRRLCRCWNQRWCWNQRRCWDQPLIQFQVVVELWCGSNFCVIDISCLLQLRGAKCDRCCISREGNNIVGLGRGPGDSPSRNCTHHQCNCTNPRQYPS